MKYFFLFVFLWLSPADASTLEAARVAVAAQPERPGLRLALAEQLLAAGDADAAELEARWVLVRWPTSGRARLILARVARARGDEAAADRWLSEAARGAAMVQAEAHALRGTPGLGGQWMAWGHLGGQYDSRALSVASVDVLPPVLGDTPAMRTLLGAGGGFRTGGLRLRAGVERTVHLPAASTDSGGTDVGELDRTSLWGEAGREVALGDHRLDFALLGRGALAGRLGSFSYGGGGPAVGWRHLGTWARPRLRLRGLGLALADADPLAWIEAEGGTDLAMGPIDLGATVTAAWIGPDVVGGREAAAELHLARAGGRARPFASAGLALRDDERGLRPKATAGLRLFAGSHAALVAEGGWQRIEARHRLLAGLALEVWR